MVSIFKHSHFRSFCVNSDAFVYNSLLFAFQADVETDVAAGQPRKRTFKKFSYRGIDLDSLLDMSTDELVKLFNARPRRRFVQTHMRRLAQPLLILT